MLKTRRAFSLVEVVVALTVLGISVAALAPALAGDHRLRGLAAETAGAARTASAHLELLATRACPGDTAGAQVEPWGGEWWRAVANRRTWRLTDSLAVRRSTAPIVIDARVACIE
jgi:prepilin-type N-terminal cleavage/methylation domain-containing protein